MIKVAIVDDHKLFRQGLGVILASKESVQLINKYESAIALLKDLGSLDLDLILLDIDMPDLDGISAIPKILKLKPTVKVIILSMHLSSTKIQEAVANKANGYLLKTSSDEEVVDAMESVMRGEEYFSKEVQDTLIDSYRRKDDPSHIELTRREKEILKLICVEHNSHEIADKLFISVNTVDTHRRNLLSKTGSKNSIGLVKYAIENDLVTYK